MQAVLFTDPHLGVNASSDLWHEVSLSFFKFVRKTCIERNINNVIILGDFFDNRKTLNLKTLNVALEAVNLLKDFNVNLLLGNHDIFYRNQPKPNSLDLFKEHNNIKIIDEIYYVTYGDTKCCFVPWHYNYYVKGNDLECDILFGHFDINGYNITDKSGVNRYPLSVGDFKHYKQTYSGHFHNPVNRNNISYIGSPFQTRFGDVGDRGLYILEDGYVKDFILFDDYPHFIKINSNGELSEDKIKGNIIKLVFNTDMGTIENNKIIDKVNSFQPLELRFDYSHINGNYEDIDISEDVIFKDKIEILHEYIDKQELGGNIKKEKLRDIIRDLLKIDEE